MNLRSEILKEHSKKQCELIVKWVGKSQQRFDELYQLFLHDEPVIMQRASYPLSYCVEQHPGLITPHLASLLENVQHKHHTAITRSTVRLLQFIPIPEEYQGRVMDTCIRFISDPSEAVAVKAFSLTVLGKLAAEYPEIIPEIKVIIEERMPFETAAFKTRAKKFLTDHL